MITHSLTISNIAHHGGSKFIEKYEKKVEKEIDTQLIPKAVSLQRPLLTPILDIFQILKPFHRLRKPGT